MELQLGPGAVDFIRAHGGECFVWTGGPCCGGTRFVESSCAARPDRERFEALSADGVTVFVRAGFGRVPERVEVRVAGRTRPRLRASFDGCAYLI